MPQPLIDRILSASPVWPVVSAEAVGVTYFVLLQKGLAPVFHSPVLFLVGVTVMPLFGGYLWHTESSNFGRGVGALLVLTFLVAGLLAIAETAHRHLA
jgi:hypothetical protein